MVGTTFLKSQWEVFRENAKFIITVVCEALANSLFIVRTYLTMSSNVDFCTIVNLIGVYKVLNELTCINFIGNAKRLQGLQ